MAQKKETKVGLDLAVDLEEFQGFAFRFTSFIQDSIKISSDPNWWEKTLGNPPDSKSQQPRTGEFLEQGAFGSGLLHIRTSPIRIDWEYVSEPRTELEKETSSLGSFEKGLETFLDPVRKWILLPEFVASRRLALAAIVLKPVSTKEEGYEFLNRYLKSVTLDPNTSDFFYQINNPRKSSTGIDQLSINRLAKWSVSRRRTLQLNIEGAILNVDPTPDDINIRIELEVNTFQDYPGMFNSTQCKIILDELVKTTKEIVSNGEP